MSNEWKCYTDLIKDIQNIVDEYIDFNNWIIVKYPDFQWPTLVRAPPPVEGPERPVFSDDQMTVHQLYLATYAFEYQKTQNKLTTRTHHLTSRLYCHCHAGYNCTQQFSSETERVEHIMFNTTRYCNTCHKDLSFDFMSCDGYSSCDDACLNAKICACGIIKTQRFAHVHFCDVTHLEYTNMREVEIDINRLTKIQPRTPEIKAQVVALRKRANQLAFYFNGADFEIGDEDDIDEDAPSLSPPVDVMNTSS